MNDYHFCYVKKNLSIKYNYIHKISLILYIVYEDL